MASTNIPVSKIREMSDEELRVLSMEKQRNGNASPSARKAQEELASRHEVISAGHSRHYKTLSDER